MLLVLPAQLFISAPIASLGSYTRHPMGATIAFALLLIFALVIATVATVLIRAWLATSESRKQPQRSSPKCVECGYDLRATPDPKGPGKVLCPECGTKNSLPARRAHLYRGVVVPTRRGHE